MRKSLPLFLVWILLATPLVAERHVVSSAELWGSLRGAAETREANRAILEKFFSSVKTPLEMQKVTKAVALLSDDELARLAAKAQQVERDFKAGALTNQELTYIVIALATAVLILVIVVAGD